jgi:hypothetical protein
MRPLQTHPWTSYLSLIAIKGVRWHPIDCLPWVVAMNRHKTGSTGGLRQWQHIDTCNCLSDQSCICRSPAQYLNKQQMQHKRWHMMLVYELRCSSIYDSDRSLLRMRKSCLLLVYELRCSSIYDSDRSLLRMRKSCLLQQCMTTQPATGDTFILVLNKALYSGNELDYFLINPNQRRVYGIPLREAIATWVVGDSLSILPAHSVSICNRCDQKNKS